MWTFDKEKLNHQNGFRYHVRFNNQPAAFSDVIHGWINDPEFRSLFNAELAEAPYSAFRWETPPVTFKISSRPFQFVLLDSPLLDRRPNPDPFSEHFDKSPDQDLLVFPNLGGDAVLIVPRQKTAGSAYGHLGAFVREAPQDQRQTLWRTVGEELSRRIKAPRPVWLNTAGGGISWLHVRLDDRPKYYQYGPFRRVDG